MSSVLDLRPPDDAHLEEHLQRDASALPDRERVVEAGLAAGYVAVSAVLLHSLGASAPASWTAVLASMLVLAVAMNVRFDVVGGFTVPTQLGFVPLVFATPPALLPVVAVVAVVLGRVPQVLRHELRPSRLLLCVPNCHFALGPAILLGVGDGLAGWSPVAVVAAAFAAQVVADFSVSSWREWYLTGAGLGEQLRDTASVYAVDLALTPVGFAIALLLDRSGLAPLAVLPLLSLLTVFSRERRARMESLLELNSAYRGTALVLSDVIEADDGYTGEHSRDVVELALEAGRELGLTGRHLRDLEFAALLHDIGKVALPKSLINKPGALDADEWALMKTHSAEGQRMLERVGGFMVGVGRIVRAHHERWDGGGYPDGLRGPDIPLAARVITACDAYNAMTTDRPYRRALPVAVARDELRAHSATQFDPDVVEAVLRVVAREP